MQFNQMPAATGIEWFRQGIKNFKQQPAAMLSLFILYFLSIAILSSIPQLGPFLVAIAGPFLNNIFFLAGREIHFKRKIRMSNLFISIKEYDGNTKKRLILLGIFYLVLTIFIAAIASTLGLKPLSGSAVNMQELSISQQQEQIIGMLTLAGLYIPITLLMWFAPVLIAWHQTMVRQAMFYSLITVWKNLGAFITYFACWVGVAILAALIATLIMQMGINPRIVLLIFMMFAITFSAAFYTSFYLTYQSCFIKL